MTKWLGLRNWSEWSPHQDSMSVNAAHAGDKVLQIHALPTANSCKFREGPRP